MFSFFTKGATKAKQRRKDNGGGSELATEKGTGAGKAGDGGEIIILSPFFPFPFYLSSFLHPLCIIFLIL